MNYLITFIILLSVSALVGVTTLAYKDTFKKLKLIFWSQIVFFVYCGVTQIWNMAISKASISVYDLTNKSIDKIAIAKVINSNSIEMSLWAACLGALCMYLWGLGYFMEYVKPRKSDKIS